MDKELKAAFLHKEKVELFLANLERLHDDKSVNDSSYKTLKNEYSSSLKIALSRIEQIKQELNKKLRSRTHELEIYKQEFANLDARFKVGHLSANEFQKLARNPAKKLSNLEDEVAHLNFLINAQQSSDITVSESSGIASLFPFKPRQPKIVSGQLASAYQSISTAGTGVSKPEAVPDSTSVTSLLILPERAFPGSSIGVIATVLNTGTETVHHRAEFRVNERIEGTHEVVLKPGQSEEITFMTHTGYPGDYHITVDNATGLLQVLPATPQ